MRELTPVILSQESVDHGAAGDNHYVVIMNKRFEGKLHVFVLNMRSGPETVKLALPANTGTLANQIDPADTWQIVDGRCERSLTPLQPLVLRLDP